MAGFFFGLGRGLRNTGGILQQQELINQQNEQMRLNAKLAQQQMDIERAKNAREQWEFEQEQKHPEWLAPADYRKQQQQTADRLERARTWASLGMQATDPKQKQAYMTMSLMELQGSDKSYIQKVGESAGIFAKEATPKLERVWNPATKQWEEREEAAGPMGNLIPESMMRATTKETARDKMLDSPVGLLKGINVVTPEGRPWPDPMATYKDAIAAGGVTISDKSKDALNQAEAAESGFEDILAQGRAVLPGVPGRLSAYLNPATLALKRAGGDPDIKAFDATKISLINHLRAVAGVARVNAQELGQVNDALQNANSYPALVAAVNQARNALRRAQPNLIKAGNLKLPDADRGTVRQPPPGAPTATGPGGAKVYWDGTHWVAY